MKSQQDASYLIQSVVKTFVEAFQVQQNHCSSGLHANLDSIDVATDLKKHTNENQNLKVLFKAIARIFLHLFFTLPECIPGHLGSYFQKSPLHRLMSLRDVAA